MYPLNCTHPGLEWSCQVSNYKTECIPFPFAINCFSPLLPFHLVHHGLSLERLLNPLLFLYAIYIKALRNQLLAFLLIQMPQEMTTTALQKLAKNWQLLIYFDYCFLLAYSAKCKLKCKYAFSLLKTLLLGLQDLAI